MNAFSDMRLLNGCLTVIIVIVMIKRSRLAILQANDVENWAIILGEEIQEIFNDATKQSDIIEMYKSHAQAEIFDPRVELKRAKHNIESYLKRRAKAAWDAKISLESRILSNLSENQLNDPLSMNFIQFMSAKTGSDSARVYAHGHTGQITEVNSTHVLNLTANANLYGIGTSSAMSAVHIPTPVYDRNVDVLLKIDWSNIDQLYRANREETRDLAFQMFCSESGFMRYYPATLWTWDNKGDGLDLFDCRSTPWYINGATLSKNVVIMVDMSGSMLGQRFEIAKQTVEAILDTLSDNDFFNIMPFSKNVRFLDECAEKAGLVQATVRNKKILRARLNSMTSEGKAEYERGLTRAFETLLMLPASVTFTTSDELADRKENGEIPEDVHYIASQDHILIVPSHLYQTIHNYSSKRGHFGCNDVLMLITDGAPAYYKEIFQLYNKNKSVRFFSFLIGEEATDIEQVKWMACENKGFMVHISNLADVQEKVQHYIKVMSRPIGKYASKFKQKDLLWSGIYNERLLTTEIKHARKKSRIKELDARREMYVTTVSYPVTLGERLMGVAAVNVPIIELTQLAHTFNLGSRSYTFMMDNNGYVMFHPQLRQTDSLTGKSKANYNNVDILELEVPQNQQLVWLKITETGKSSTACKTDIFDAECIRIKRWQLNARWTMKEQMRSAMLNCNNKDTITLDVLYATQNLDRVYKQLNTYYAECIDDTLFTIGVAVAKGDEKRIKPRKPIDYAEIELSWFKGLNWKMHPEWRYCLLNDSDSSLTAEEAFRVYVEQMRHEGALPRLCESRRQLVDRFIFDMKVTNGLIDLWNYNAKTCKKRQIHIVFLATPSGLIKYWDEIPEDLTYNDPNLVNISQSTKSFGTPSQQQKSYLHLIENIYRRSIEDPYYRRAVRMKNRIIIDINTKTNLWHKSESTSTYGNQENISALMTATKAIYLNGALIGVTGIEFTVDFFGNILKKIGCGPQDNRQICILLDEHGYVVYTSLNSTRYSRLFSTNNDYESNWLGRWFGNINRITEATMSLLLKNNYYTETIYVDYQAVCNRDVLLIQAAGALRPVLSVIKSVLWIFTRLWALLKEFAIMQLVGSLINPTIAYTSLFTESEDGFACDKASTFFLANWGEDGWMGPRIPDTASLISDNLAERPCKQNPAKCAVKMYASWVNGTNLLLVVIVQSRTSSSVCYDKNQCPMISPPELQFAFTQIDNISDKQQAMSMEPSDPFSNDIADRYCRHIRAKERKSPSICLHTNDDESDFSCSKTTLAVPSLTLFFFSIVGIVH